MKSKYNKIYSERALNDMLNETNDEYNNLEYVARLRTCNAIVYVSKKYGTYYLRSYDTFVASIDAFLNDDGSYTYECDDYLRVVYGYTATSAQHINKFFADYAEDEKHIFRYDIDNKGIYYKRVS